MSVTAHRITARTTDVSRRSSRHRGLLLAAGVVGATLGSFLLGTCWYIVFGAVRSSMLASNLAATTTVAPSAAVIVLELLREAVVAAGMSFAVGRMRIGTYRAGLGAALLSWLVFPGVLLTGSVLWDGVPASLAAIHSGDWLIKLVLVTTVAVAVRRRIDRA